MKTKNILAAFLVAIMLLGILAGCNSNSSTTSDATYKLTVSGINGSINYLPVYIAEKKGWFKEAGLEIDEVMFDNGPVQMEALASNAWDIATTGVGGVLTGVIGYDAVIVGASNSDDGTQTIFVRNDSKIAKAGTGHNSVNDKIYGDAESWKGAKVLVNSGTVLEYLLIRTLKGFGLTLDDVVTVSMDSPTANSAFLAGEGDAAVLTGAVSFSPDKRNYTVASSGNLAKTGLMCNFVANKASLENADKKEAMKVFLDVYFKTLDWIKDNSKESYELMSEFSQATGANIDVDTAMVYLTQDKYYTLEEVYNMMHNKSANGDYSEMEGRILEVLQFFIDAGKYKSEDIQKFQGHMDTSLIDALYEKNS